MSLGDLAQEGFFEDLVVTRRAAGAYVKGRWVDGSPAPAPLTISAVVTPATAREVERLVEGAAQKGGIKIFSETRLVATSEATQRQGDLVAYDGDTFEVISSERHPHLDLAHYLSIAVRVVAGLDGA